MNLFLKYAAFAAVATSVTLASCNNDDDDPVAVENRAPELSLSDSSVVDVIAGEFASVDITTADADGNLQSIGFEQNPGTFNTSNVRIGDQNTDIEQQILLIDGSDATDGETKTYFFRAPVNDGDSVTYTITLVDDDGLEDNKELTIYASVPLKSLSAVLLKNADGTGTGGLNLETGNGVPKADSAANIIDLGIDLAKPSESNWRKQIAPANGAALHLVSESYLTENGLTFESLRTRSQIAAAYDDTSVDSPQTPEISDEGGEVFIVLKDDVYYYVQVDEVVNTSDDNNDQYVLSIKF